MKGSAEVFRMQGKRFCAVVSAVFICFTLMVCDSQGNSVPLTYDEAVKKVTFTGNVATVDFTNLDNHTIYLVKINSSNSVVPAANTGGVAQALPVISSEKEIGIPFLSEDRLYSFHGAIKEFNANPPRIDMEARHSAILAVNSVSYSVGDKRTFWVERNVEEGSWEQRPATLMAAGEYGNIWVTDANTSSGTSENKISTTRAQEMAGRFDRIYPLTTNLLGYEYGGGPDGDGGMDGDSKIQILVYDFYDLDYGSGGTSYAGYFYSKDFYTQTELDRSGLQIKTNLAEMFYLNASAVINSPDFIFSTLIHEFQHMINFNRKFVIQKINSSAWYDEMLSMVAEDVIGPLVGIGRTNPGHPISVRIPRFLDLYYKHGITEWNNYYPTAYAFGAYLVRNYGGPELLKRILDNNKTDVDSITMALKEFSEDMDFNQALNRYGEAIIFSGSSIPEDGANGIGVVTFDKTVTSTVNGQEYTAYGFNIWQTLRPGTNYRGPLILDLEAASMRPHSVIIHSASQWRNKTGDLSVTLEKPSNQNVILFLMAR